MTRPKRAPPLVALLFASALIVTESAAAGRWSAPVSDLASATSEWVPLSAQPRATEPQAFFAPPPPQFQLHRVQLNNQQNSFQQQVAQPQTQFQQAPQPQFQSQPQPQFQQAPQPQFQSQPQPQFQQAPQPRFQSQPQPQFQSQPQPQFQSQPQPQQVPSFPPQLNQQSQFHLQPPQLPRQSSANHHFLHQIGIPHNLQHFILTPPKQDFPVPNIQQVLFAPPPPPSPPQPPQQPTLPSLQPLPRLPPLPQRPTRIQHTPIPPPPPAPSPTPTPKQPLNREKEEVQLLYVPVETLRQQGRLPQLPVSSPQTSTTSAPPPSPSPSPSSTPTPHQPPLSVYMGPGGEDAKIGDVLQLLKDARTIPVLDQVGPDAPQVFVGPAGLNPPPGYAKFELPYLSSLDSNRIERKVNRLPFFVAPLSFQPPNGYSKILLPPPHIGSVVVSNSTSPTPTPVYVSSTTPLPPPPSTESSGSSGHGVFNLPSQVTPVNPRLPTLVNSLEDTGSNVQAAPQHVRPGSPQRGRKRPRPQQAVQAPSTERVFVQSTSLAPQTPSTPTPTPQPPVFSTQEPQDVRLTPTDRSNGLSTERSLRVHQANELHSFIQAAQQEQVDQFDKTQDPFQQFTSPQTVEQFPRVTTEPPFRQPQEQFFQSTLEPFGQNQFINFNQRPQQKENQFAPQTSNEPTNQFRPQQNENQFAPQTSNEPTNQFRPQQNENQFAPQTSNEPTNQFRPQQNENQFALQTTKEPTNQFRPQHHFVQFPHTEHLFSTPVATPESRPQFRPKQPALPQQQFVTPISQLSEFSRPQEDFDSARNNLRQPEQQVEQNEDVPSQEFESSRNQLRQPYEQKQTHFRHPQEQQQHRFAPPQQVFETQEPPQPQEQTVQAELNSPSPTPSYSPTPDPTPALVQVRGRIQGVQEVAVLPQVPIELQRPPHHRQRVQFHPQVEPSTTQPTPTTAVPTRRRPRPRPTQTTQAVTNDPLAVRYTGKIRSRTRNHQQLIQRQQHQEEEQRQQDQHSVSVSTTSQAVPTETTPIPTNTVEEENYGQRSTFDEQPITRATSTRKYSNFVRTSSRRPTTDATETAETTTPYLSRSRTAASRRPSFKVNRGRVRARTTTIPTSAAAAEEVIPTQPTFARRRPTTVAPETVNEVPDSEEQESVLPPRSALQSTAERHQRIQQTVQDAQLDKTAQWGEKPQVTNEPTIEIIQSAPVASTTFDWSAHAGSQLSNGWTAERASAEPLPPIRYDGLGIPSVVGNPVDAPPSDHAIPDAEALITTTPETPVKEVTKKSGAGKKRGSWVRVRVKRPRGGAATDSDGLVTAESQNSGIASGNALIPQPLTPSPLDDVATPASQTTTTPAPPTTPIPTVIPTSSEVPPTSTSYDVVDVDSTSTPEPFIADEGLTTDQPNSTLPPSANSPFVGTSTSTKVSMETEICYRGRCIKTPTESRQA